MVIEIYGKEIKKDNTKFISCSTKIEHEDKTVEFVNVRFTQDSGYTAVKGLQKVEFDMANANVKNIKGQDDKEYKTLYISKATGIEYTEEEKQLMREKQAKKVADLFN